jgi:hypothetical protein
MHGMSGIWKERSQDQLQCCKGNRSHSDRQSRPRSRRSLSWGNVDPCRQPAAHRPARKYNHVQTQWHHWKLHPVRMTKLSHFLMKKRSFSCPRQAWDKRKVSSSRNVALFAGAAWADAADATDAVQARTFLWQCRQGWRRGGDLKRCYIHYSAEANEWRYS